MDKQDTKYSALDVALCTLRTAVNSRFNQVETWFNNMRAINSPEIPKEILFRFYSRGNSRQCSGYSCGNYEE